MRTRQRRPIGSAVARGSVYVDTSGWIALFSARDQNHAEADRLFREAIARNVPLITANLVLAEVHRLILHRVGAEGAALALDRIESSARVSIVFASAAHHAAAKAWLARMMDRGVTYTDAVGFAIIGDLRCIGFVSFDSDFLHAGFRPWLPS